MNCSLCGRKLQEGDRFCPGCGATVTETPSVQESPAPNAGMWHNANRPSNQPKQQSKTPYFILILLAISFVAEFMWGYFPGPPAVKFGATVGAVAAPMLISVAIAALFTAITKIFSNKSFKSGFSNSFLATWLILLVIALPGTYLDHEAKIKALSNTHSELVKLEPYAAEKEKPTYPIQGSSTHNTLLFSAGDIDTADAETLQQFFTEIQKVTSDEQSKLNTIRQKEKVIDLNDALDSAHLSSLTGIADAQTKINEERKLVQMERDVDVELLTKYSELIANLPDGQFKVGAERSSPEKDVAVINDYINTRLKILDTFQQVVEVYPEIMGNNRPSDKDIAKFERIRIELKKELAHRDQLNATISDARQQFSSELSSLEQSTSLGSTSH